jgi:hypothetical protein
LENKKSGEDIHLLKQKMIMTHDRERIKGKGTKNETSLRIELTQGLEMLVSPFAEKWSRRGVGHEMCGFSIVMSSNAI